MLVDNIERISVNISEFSYVPLFFILLSIFYIMSNFQAPFIIYVFTYLACDMFCYYFRLKQLLDK